MKTTIDAAGRVVIPKKIRDAAGLQPGTRLEVRYYNGLVEIEPEAAKVKLVREGRFLVAVPLDDQAAVLTSEDVEAVREAIYEERERGFLS
jgi:AbrB family looped-hinge helix DNA binding protein